MTMHFDNTYARLPERFFARQHPVRVPEPTLIRLNRGLAAELSLDTEWLQSAEALLHEYPLRVGQRGPHFSGPSAGATLLG